MLLNVVELADSLGVEESVVEEWVRREGLPCVRDRGRLLFDRHEVITWAAARGRAAKAGFLVAEENAGTGPAQIESMFRAGGIWRNLSPGQVLEAMRQIVGRLPGATPTVRQFLETRLQQPGAISWAPVGGGVALPHLRSPAALGPGAGTIALMFLTGPLQGSEPPPDGQAITRLFFFVAPSPRAHLELLGRFAAALDRGNLRRLLLEAAPDEAIFAALAARELALPRKENL